MPNTIPGINFNFDLLCRTTGWHNDCGLNCLSHYLAAILLNGRAQTELSSNAGLRENYNKLLTTFQEFYQLPETPTLNNLCHFIENHPSPLDREILIAPVLRLHLAKILNESHELLWDTYGTVAFYEHITKGKTSDVAQSVYKANKPMMDGLKAFYDSERRKIKRSDPNYATKIDELQTGVLLRAKQYWDDEGCNNFANYMGELKNDEMVSADQLQTLCAELGIACEIYTPSSIKASLKDPALCSQLHGKQSEPEPGAIGTMRVYNKGKHWEYEEPNLNAVETSNHNRFYRFGWGIRSNQDDLFMLAKAELLSLKSSPDQGPPSQYSI